MILVLFTNTYRVNWNTIAKLNFLSLISKYTLLQDEPFRLQESHHSCQQDKN